MTGGWGRAASLLCAAVAALVARVVLLLSTTRARRRRLAAQSRLTLPPPPSLAIARELARRGTPRRAPFSLLVVLGSGGHTAEMLTLLCDVLPHHACAEVVFVLGATDKHSLQKAAHVHRAHHARCAAHGAHAPRYRVIPRAREVGQPPATSVLSTLRAFVAALRVLLRHRPALLLCNGPANAAVVAAAAFACRVLGLLDCRVVYVESFARVLSLSVSGRLLLPFVDRFIVQWPQLRDKYALAEYYGRLC